ncbi:FGGY-family carbohydrate kinase [Tumidithrix helvetica]|uniref:FGGY-family carbohydrate kinase n=1 Tax=Tumidithrix helvetica TaxID=3457545 RepID=UPI003CC65A41
MNLYLGIDFGTSGARAIAIDAEGRIHATARCEYSIRDISTWEAALFSLLEQMPFDVRQGLQAIAVDATSATVLVTDAKGQPVSQPHIYSDACNAQIVDLVKTFAPAGHTVLSATSSLAKLVQAIAQLADVDRATNQSNAPYYFLHQADWLSFLLHGNLGISDYHNALKLGYDVAQLCYPDWLTHWLEAELHRCQLEVQLPKVFVPGQAISLLKPELAQKFGIHPHCWICAGTTDSTAAFFASIGSSAPTVGAAVTSLGSTLVVKICSQVRLDDPRYGLYSHRLDTDREILWLVGGGSNTGGAVLKQFFSDRELQEFSERIPASQPSHLDYYPLPSKGERFPVYDPDLLPRLTPRPDDPVEFLHGLLESMAKIEARGYELLRSLGASPIAQIYTAGGGAKNAAWTDIRRRYLAVPLVPAIQTEAAYGTALLAQQTILQPQSM